MGDMARWRIRGWVRPEVLANNHCPVCGTPVVVGPTTRLGRALAGPMFAPPPQAEVAGACAIHGRFPWNRATKRLRDQQ